MEFRVLWEIVWRRKWIIIQAFAVIFLIIMLGTFVLTPVYETSAKILMRDSNEQLSLLAQLGLAPSSSPAPREDPETVTRVELVAVNPYLEKVISKLQLRTSKGELMKSKELQKSTFLISVIFPKPYVEMEALEDTALIKITAKACDPEEAAIIANTVAEVYIDETLKDRKEECRKAKELVEAQCETVRVQYVNRMKEIEKFKAETDSIDLDKETEIAIDKMATLIKAKESNISDIADATARMETVRKQLDQESEAALSGAAISESSQFEELKNQLNDLNLQLAGVLTEKTPDHPSVIAINRQIKRVREEIDKEVGILQKSGRDLQSIERELAALRARGESIDTDLEQQTAVLRTIPEKETDLAQLQSKHMVTADLYKSLLIRLGQLWVAEPLILSNVQLIEPAVVPETDKPKTPDKVVNAVLGIFLGVVFGFGLGFMVDYMDDTISSAAHVKEQGMVFLGAVRKTRRKESPLISGREPKDFLSESYRAIRNAIKCAGTDKPMRSLLIASSLPKEGRSTVALNLAVSFIREGKDVLIVDADMRKPSMHVLCKQAVDREGLSGILEGELALADVIRKTSVEGLSLLSAGKLPSDPGRILESSKMRELIRDLSQQYDIVVVDSPPVLMADDAVVAGGYVDAVVYVMESERVSRRELSRAYDRLSHAKIQPIGVILNKFKVRRCILFPSRDYTV